MSIEEENKSLIKHAYELFNQGKLLAVVECED